MIFFTSDHHFGHANIIKYCQRPFASADEMNEEMIRRWNSVVTIEDTVYYLGDFSLSNQCVERFVPRLNGQKYLLMGNRDTCHPCHKKKAAAGLAIYEKAGFISLGLEAHLDIAGEKVLLNHMPYFSEEPSPEYKIKYKEFRPKDEGLWLLHGHIHEKWKTRGKMINVGVDVWDFYPVPITEIEKMI